MCKKINSIRFVFVILSFLYCLRLFHFSAKTINPSLYQFFIILLKFDFQSHFFYYSYSCPRLLFLLFLLIFLNFTFLWIVVMKFLLDSRFNKINKILKIIKITRNYNLIFNRSMTKIVVLGNDYCPYCRKVANYFKDNNIPFEYVDT